MNEMINAIRFDRRFLSAIRRLAGRTGRAREATGSLV